MTRESSSKRTDMTDRLYAWLWQENIFSCLPMKNVWKQINWTTTDSSNNNTQEITKLFKFFFDRSKHGNALHFGPFGVTRLFIHSFRKISRSFIGQTRQYRAKRSNSVSHLLWELPLLSTNHDIEFTTSIKWKNFFKGRIEQEKNRNVIHIWEQSWLTALCIWSDYSLYQWGLSYNTS